MNHPANFYDRTGIRYSMLLVIAYGGQTKAKKSRWLCRCDCGVEKIVNANNLTQKNVVSCGCFGRELRRKLTTTHGDSKSAEFKTWSSIKERCSEKSKDFRNYGARGIKVCKRWLESYENFLADMGRKPSPKHSIERKNNDLGYSPDNCKWGTMREQSNNTRRNRFLTHDGLTMTTTQWSERVGFLKSTVRERLDRGWSVERALTTPVKVTK